AVVRRRGGRSWAAERSGWWGLGRWAYGVRRPPGAPDAGGCTARAGSGGPAFAGIQPIGGRAFAGVGSVGGRGTCRKRPTTVGVLADVRPVNGRSACRCPVRRPTVSLRAEEGADGATDPRGPRLPRG